MTQVSAWAITTVQDFFQRCNWLGPISSAPAPSQTRLAATWQCQTVATFFQNHNWSGQIQQPDKQQTSIAPQPATLTDPVGYYFGVLPWDGHPTIGYLPAVTSGTGPAKTEHDLSLSDLSNLF